MGGRGTYIRLIKLLSGPLLGLLVYLSFDFGGELPARVAAIAIWMAAWWILEVVHLSVTALLPLFLFPVSGIMDMQSVSTSYMNQVIFLFIGGFMIAIAMEKWDLHRRFALRILLAVGATPSRILLGFMVTCFFLSMWISNTATVMMLLPAVLAVIAQVQQFAEGESKSLAAGLLLGLAYAGSIGGTATLVGSPPNLIFQHFYESHFEAGFINFSRWFLFGFPVALLFLVIAFFLLKAFFLRNVSLSIDRSFLYERYNALGEIRYEEKVVSIVFALTAFLWFTRADLTIGTLTLPGWSNLFAHPEYFHDSTVAMLMAGLLFILPARTEEQHQILEWSDMKRLPFGIIFLFGGGFALAKGVETSGLTEWMAQQLSLLGGLSTIFLVMGLCAFMTFTTELTSNTASTQLVMPVLIALSQGVDVNPLLIMVPVTFSASYAFMLPVATPPNTIIFGSEQISIPQMAKTGIWFNLIGVGLLTLALLTWGKWVFGI